MFRLHLHNIPVIEKHKEYQLLKYIDFIDFGKAFNRVNRGRLCVIRVKKGNLQHLIRAMQNLHEKKKIITETRRRNTAHSVGLINCGVRHGWPISHSLFHLRVYIDNVIHNWQRMLLSLIHI